jgi:hypothetical protein
MGGFGVTARVIDDPSALGWEYDPDTGRWTWGGGSSSGGGNGTFPEAPVDGQQYARQDAGWAVIVHPDNGGGGSGGNDPRITDQQITSWDLAVSWDDHSKQGYLKTESDPTVPQHVKDITQTDIANWNAGTGNGGGGGVDPRISDTQISNWDTAHGWGNHATKGYLTNASLSGYATQTWVSQNYQPKGSYISTESDPTVPSWVKSISQNDINKWNNPPSGGGDDPNAVKLTGDQVINGVKTFAGGTTYFKNLFLSGVSAGGVGISGAARIEFSSGATTLYGSSNTLQVNSGGTSITGGITCTGVITGTDCVASSDERLKDSINTAPVGLIDSINGREWVWKESGNKGSGVVAQELEEVLPHLVHTNDKGMKSVSYMGLCGYLIEEIKALKAEVGALKNG